MAKFFGVLGVITGYTEKLENGIPTGVYEPDKVEYAVSGDLLQNRQNIQASNTINDDITLSNRFSILASPSLLATVSSFQESNSSVYMEIWGMKWKVSSIEINPPRVILSVGGRWNEEKNSN